MGNYSSYDELQNHIIASNLMSETEFDAWNTFEIAYKWNVDGRVMTKQVRK